MTTTKKFRVTPRMLEVVDDYMRGEKDTNAAVPGLKYHCPRLTQKQIQTVLARWKKEMRTDDPLDVTGNLEMSARATRPRRTARR